MTHICPEKRTVHPGRSRRRRSDAALNHAAILDSARLLLADDSDASIAAIAEHAGLGRGTVHRHFATREELIAAVRRQARDDAESDEEDHLRPPGELAAIVPATLSVSDVLNEGPAVPARRADRRRGAAAARRLLRRALRRRPRGDDDAAPGGRRDLPRAGGRPARGGAGDPPRGLAALHDVFAELLPGAVVAPLHLRGRAIGVLLAVGSVGDAVRDLAQEAAVALALAPGYTDFVDTMRRTRPTSPAAEIQQNLLPPRIARIGGATLAGNVLPGYEIGGDWFDYAENQEGAWIGIADSAGTGPRAAALGAVSLGAFRATRRGSTDPATVVAAMHAVLLELADPDATATAIVGLWNAPASNFRWVTSGEQRPVRVGVDGKLEVLGDGRQPELGSRPSRTARSPSSPAAWRRASACCCCPTASSSATAPTAPASGSQASGRPPPRRRTGRRLGHAAGDRGRGRRRLLRLAGVAPENGRAALRGDHRVDRVLLHQDDVGERGRDRAAGAALADHAGHDRHTEPRHRRL